ncbi:MAG: hypothetical protein DWQ40_11935 [Actinobacteria bacterium]|nr:MAG: hypothetical protein DWQ40_11935 [Actinomycetota bacterium]REK35746.1 MAG: hypothetical protein DWQ20_05845 [Actinomycetota bacterium]
MFKSIGRTASRMGIGIVAGAAGTAALTLVQKIEMKITGRDSSTTPADTVDEVMGIAPDDDQKRERFSNLAHWGYGTALGAVRGLLGSTPLKSPIADVAFFAGVWGAPMIYLPALDITSPPTEWGLKQVAIDMGHHLVYAGTVAGIWYLLTKESPVSEDTWLSRLRFAA